MRKDTLVVVVLSTIVVVWMAITPAFSASPAAAGEAVWERLGQELFSSTAFSKNGERSCASCHVPAFGFSGGQPVASTIYGEAERRRTPTLYGVTFAQSLMWDGRAPDLEHQLLLPLEGPELGVQWPQTLSRLAQEKSIVAMTRAADISLDRDATIRALAAYVRSLDRRMSRFDQYTRGDVYALSEQELRGFRIFQRKARCSTCHLINSQVSPFTDGQFHVTGAGLSNQEDDDKGRLEVTDRARDKGAFKTPSLRGAALRPYLLHNGKMQSVRQVIEYYNSIDVDAMSGIDPRLAPLHLAAQDIDDLVAFIGALTPSK